MHYLILVKIGIECVITHLTFCEHILTIINEVLIEYRIIEIF